eukprot:3551428-Prymnesium_polylepis.1
MARARVRVRQSVAANREPEETWRPPQVRRKEGCRTQQRAHRLASEDAAALANRRHTSAARVADAAQPAEGAGLGAPRPAFSHK